MEINWQLEKNHMATGFATGMATNWQLIGNWKGAGRASPGAARRRLAGRLGAGRRRRARPGSARGCPTRAGRELARRGPIQLPISC